MALNLWKTYKGVISYNPFPTGSYLVVPINLGDYQVTIKARSATNGRLHVATDQATEFAQFVQLSPVNQTFVYTFTNKSKPNFMVKDIDSKGDIIIDSIELVQKPLPKLTLNGIDGFLSGKWTLRAEAIVVDDETLVLNATATDQHIYSDYIPVQVGQVFNYGVTVTGGQIALQLCDGNKTPISTTATTPYTIPSGISYIWVRLSNTVSGAGQYTFKRPCLNLGTTAIPYSKKTGDKMVLPAVKKNLFDGQLIGGYISATTQTNAGTISDGVVSANYINVKTNTTYVLKNFSRVSLDKICYSFYDLTKTAIGNRNYITGKDTVSFTTPSNCSFLRFSFDGGQLTDQFQLEEGTTATSFSPFAVQVNKKPQRKNTAKTGLSFNGTSDYLQLPSMTMDSVEIECNLDASNGSTKYLIDARSGLSGGYLINQTNIPSAWQEVREDGNILSNPFNPTKGKRIKILAKSTSVFTDDVTIFDYRSSTGVERMKGTLYKVTCYLSGNVVAQYDFENPKNIVGNQIIPSAKNLIPSFEDARWSLHANSKVLGKDVLHLDATAGFQENYVDLPVIPSQKYMLMMPPNGQNLYVLARETPFVSFGDARISNGSVIFTTTASMNKVRIVLGNNTTGSFDFIRPQLYQLGLEGTLNGTPTPSRKQAKRQLYAKR